MKLYKKRILLVSGIGDTDCFNFFQTILVILFLWGRYTQIESSKFSEFFHFYRMRKRLF